MFGSFVAVGVPYIVSLILRLVYAVGYGLPILENLFSVRSVIVLLIQFVISFAVFKKLQNEEGYGALIGWGVIGAIVVIFVVPFAVTYAISL